MIVFLFFIFVFQISLMKFSHSIQINSTPEWRDHYIAYSRLKKVIYDTEKATLGLMPLPKEQPVILPSDLEQNIDSEMSNNPERLSSSPIIKASIDDANLLFISVLDQELSKIVKFYSSKESELIKQMNSVEDRILDSEETEQKYLSRMNQLPSPLSRSGYTQISSHDREEEEQQLSSSKDVKIKSMNANELHTLPAYFVNLMWASQDLKRIKSELTSKLVNLYVALNELSEYVEINETGFR